MNLEPKIKYILKNVKSSHPRNGFLFDNYSQSFPAISDHLVVLYLHDTIKKTYNTVDAWQNRKHTLVKVWTIT